MLKLVYREKRIWDSNGTISDPQYDPQVVSVISSPTLSTQYTVKNLVPFTAYSFQLTAVNSFGECKSEWSEDYYTHEELPRRQSTPIVQNFTSRSAFIEWTPCSIPNGLILYYKLLVFELKPQLVQFSTVLISFIKI